MLRVDERAHWSPSSKKVWCTGCVRGTGASPQGASSRAASGSSPNNAGATGPSHETTASPKSVKSQSPWQRLCLYAERCVAAEAAKSLVPHAQQGSRWFAFGGFGDSEQLVVGDADWVPATGNLWDQAAAGRPSATYGWPTVVVMANHQPMVAPLFSVPLERDADRDDRWHATTEPAFNLAVTASGTFDPVIVEEVGELLDHGLPFGDAEAMAKLAARTAALLGLDVVSPLNARALEPNVGRGTGIYNAAVVVLVESSSYTESLRKELDGLLTREDWPCTAAAQLLDGSAERAPNGRSYGALAAPLPCNQAQEETLERIRRDRLTVVTGPPGTGKTQLVVNAVANAWLDGGTVLVTSTNNGAVDVAVERAENDVGTGLLVRTGNRSQREQVPARVTLASAEAADWHGNQAKSRALLRRVAGERSDLLEMLHRLDELDRSLLRALERREELARDLRKATRQLWGRGQPPELPMTPRQAERRARRLLRTRWFPHARGRRLRKALRCRDSTDVNEVVAMAALPSLRSLRGAGSPGLEEVVSWASLKQGLERTELDLERERAERARLQSEIGDPSRSLREADRRWAEASLRALRDETATRIGSGAERVATLSRSAANTQAFKKAIGGSFRNLRGWACTALAAQSNFPLEAGLFDLVIVDEASQCSLAAVLPLAYRAKRLLIVGDPHQLNPIATLDDLLLRKIATLAGFDNNDLRERGFHYKDGSAYDAFEFATRPRPPALLNEHYRCHPHIARWFNKAFYGGALTVLTEVSEPLPANRAIQWRDVEGEAIRPARGSWVNDTEALHTVQLVVRLLESGYKTIGVVTPFTAQANRIDQLVKQRLDKERMEEIGFVSGTAHRLQGDDRDAIVLSAVLAPGMAKSGVRWMGKGTQSLKRRRQSRPTGADRSRPSKHGETGKPHPGVAACLSTRVGHGRERQAVGGRIPHGQRLGTTPARRDANGGLGALRQAERGGLRAGFRVARSRDSPEHRGRRRSALRRKGPTEAPRPNSRPGLGTVGMVGAADSRMAVSRGNRFGDQSGGIRPASANRWDAVTDSEHSIRLRNPAKRGLCAAPAAWSSAPSISARPFSSGPSLWLNSASASKREQRQ